MYKPSASHARQLVPTTSSPSWPVVRDFVREQIDEHPIRSTLVTVGAGYLLGGGLFSALTGRVVVGSLRLALRVLTLPVVIRSGVELGRQCFTDTPPSSAQ